MIVRYARPLAVAATLGLTLFAAGCGGDSDSGKSSAYCKALDSARADIVSLTADDSTPDLTRFDTIVAELVDISEKAPDEVADDWATLTGALKTLTDALAEYGLTMQDLVGAMATGQMPEGVSMEDLTALGAKVQALSSEDIDAASTAIAEHAKDTCEIDLESTS